MGRMPKQRVGPPKRKRVRRPDKPSFQRSPDPYRKPPLSGLNPLGVLRTLPGMQVHEVRRVWLNAARKLGSADTPDEWRVAASKVMDAVESQWQQRGVRTRLSDDYFRWPSTEVIDGDGQLASVPRPEGMLSFLEYHVGRTNGQPPGVRKVILERIFSKPLPRVFDDEYMAEWSTPSSPRRLRKRAECLAAFARNAKTRNPGLLNDAIQDWESDLEWLHDRYYVGHFHFAWPTTVL